MRGTKEFVHILEHSAKAKPTRGCAASRVSIMRWGAGGQVGGTDHCGAGRGIFQWERLMSGVGCRRGRENDVVQHERRWGRWVCGWLMVVRKSRMSDVCWPSWSLYTRLLSPTYPTTSRQLLGLDGPYCRKHVSHPSPPNRFRHARFAKRPPTSDTAGHIAQGTG